MYSLFIIFLKETKVMINLHNDDCFNIFPNIPRNSIDLFICDLPYNQTNCSWDKIPFDLDKLWIQLKRIGKKHSAYIFTTTTKFGHTIIESNKKMFRYDIVYEKTMSLGFYHANQMPLRSHEMIYVFYKHLPTYNPIMIEGHKPYVRQGQGPRTELYTHYTDRTPTICKDGKRYPRSVIKFSNGNYKSKHPCSKPYDLFEWIIKSYSNPYDNVLDCCMGVGNSGLACRNLKRNYVGIEIDKKYFEIAKENIKNSI